MTRIASIVGTAVAYALIIGIAVVVCAVCFLGYPVHLWLERNMKELKRDRLLRERAQLVMLKTGRLV